MKKMNKKGFTLVEMLVVIAIIAILVSILIPTVLGATKKAKAATDAANLRSALAEFEIAYLTGESSGTVEGFTGVDSTKNDDGVFTEYTKNNSAKSKLTDATTITIKLENDAWDAYFGDKNIEAFSYAADHGKFSN